MVSWLGELGGSASRLSGQTGILSGTPLSAFSPTGIQTSTSFTHGPPSEPPHSICSVTRRYSTDGPATGIQSSTRGFDASIGVAGVPARQFSASVSGSVPASPLSQSGAENACGAVCARPGDKRSEGPTQSRTRAMRLRRMDLEAVTRLQGTRHRGTSSSWGYNGIDLWSRRGAPMRSTASKGLLARSR